MRNFWFMLLCTVVMAMVLGTTVGCEDEGDDDDDTDLGTDTTETDTDTENDTGKDTEEDTDEDTDSVTPHENCEEGDDPDYFYTTECIGTECTTGSCCDGATCGEALYGGADQGIIANYCFPEPNELATDVNPCECGDMAVQFQLDEAGTQFWTACVAKGTVVTSANLKFPIMSAEYIENAPGGQLDMSDIRQFPATVVSAELSSLAKAQQPTFTMGFGIEDYIDLDGDEVEDDQALFLILQGVKGMSTVWMMQTLVPGDKWTAGTLANPTDAADGSTNFNSSLLKGTLAGQSISKMWIEGMALQGDLVIETAPEVCGTKGGTGCTEASFGYDLDIIGARAELDMSEE